MKMPRTSYTVKLSRLPHRRCLGVSAPRKPSKYLRDADVLHAAVVTGLVVVLFGRRLEHDAPGHDYRQRLQRALVLARQQQTDHLLLLGGCSGSELSEAAAGEAWLRQHELTGDVRVELEQDSIDSLENLRHARRLLLERGHLPPVALVTSRYHLARCLLL